MRLMKQRIENFYKQDVFNMFHKKDNPFSFVTTRIDISNIYKLCQEKNIFMLQWVITYVLP